MKKRVLILIDNLDRLTHKKILEILELVKDVADFPSITFVLAFDDKAVSVAIQEELKLDPGHYLEKIISDEFNLKWAENQFNYLQHYIFKSFFESLSLLNNPNSIKILHKSEEGKTKQTEKLLLEILIIEVFRVKYLRMVENNEGVELIKKR